MTVPAKTPFRWCVVWSTVMVRAFVYVVLLLSAFPPVAVVVEGVVVVVVVVLTAVEEVVVVEEVVELSLTVWNAREWRVGKTPAVVTRVVRVTLVATVPEP